MCTSNVGYINKANKILFEAEVNSTQQEEYYVRYNKGIIGSIQIAKNKLFKTLNAFGICNNLYAYKK